MFLKGIFRGIEGIVERPETAWGPAWFGISGGHPGGPVPGLPAEPGAFAFEDLLGEQEQNSLMHGIPNP